MHYTGQPMKRVEDPHLVTGKGSFVDDVQLPDILHAAVLRSPHAHAHRCTAAWRRVSGRRCWKAWPTRRRASH